MNPVTLSVNGEVLTFCPSTRRSWSADGQEIGPESGSTGNRDTVSVTHLVLQLTTDCNMSCEYCYETKRGCDPMLLDVAIEAVSQAIARRGRKAICIHFFGGEPLLQFPTIVQVVKHARSLSGAVTFQISTNGVLLDDDVLAFVNEHAFRLIVSWDGGKGHTFRRTTAGSDVSSGLLRTLRSQCQTTDIARKLAVRYTVTPMSAGIVDDIRLLVDTGVMSVILKDVTSDSRGLRWDSLDVPKSLYAQLAEYYLRCRRAGLEINLEGRGVGFTTILRDINGLRPRVVGCQCGLTSITVTPDGTYIPCSRYSDMQESLGSVESALNDGSRRLAQIPAPPAACDSCFARPACGGPCHAVVQHYPNMTPPDGQPCVMTRHRVSHAIWLRHALTRQAEKEFTR